MSDKRNETVIATEKVFSKSVFEKKKTKKLKNTLKSNHSSRFESEKSENRD